MQSELGALKDASVLITGATGFIGRHLTNRLIAGGLRPALLTRRTDLAADADGPRLYHADLDHPASLSDAVRQAAPDIIFHLAGFADPSRDLALSAQAVAQNLTATMALARAAHDLGTSAFVHTGTGEEYGAQQAPFAETLTPRPASPYSAAKLAATAWLQMMHDTFAFPATTLRVFLCYGPGQPPPKLVPSAIVAALAGRDFPMTSGNQRREFIYVDDLCDALIRAATTPSARGEIINAGTGQDMTVRDAAETIYRLCDAQGKVRAGAVPDRANDLQSYCADITKAQAVLEWSPKTSFEDGLAATIGWARSTGNSPVPINGLC